MSVMGPVTPFHPRILGELEEAVMDVLWGSIAPLNVREVQARLDRELAYTTVMTTLDRLFRKGLLEREKEGQAFLYHPALSRGDLRRRMMAGLLEDWLPETGGEALAAFVDLATVVDDSNLDRLAALIETRKRERGR